MSGSQGALTYAQLLTQVRTIVQDQVQPFRYQDSELYFALTEAMADARMLRPDLFLAMGLDAAPFLVTPAMANDQFPIAWQYVPAFIDYIIGRAEGRDDTYTDDSRAATLMARFVQRMTGAAK
jgi:hypothetical protein